MSLKGKLQTKHQIKFRLSQAYGQTGWSAGIPELPKLEPGSSFARSMDQTQVFFPFPAIYHHRRASVMMGWPLHLPIPSWPGCAASAALTATTRLWKKQPHSKPISKTVYVSKLPHPLAPSSLCLPWEFPACKIQWRKQNR